MSTKRRRCFIETLGVRSGVSKVVEREGCHVWSELFLLKSFGVFPQSFSSKVSQGGERRRCDAADAEAAAAAGAKDEERIVDPPSVISLAC